MKSKRAQLSLLIAATVLTQVALSACRSARRGVRVGNDAATLTIKMNDLLPSDQNRQEWVYELSVCVNTLNGTLASPTEVQFTAIGLKKGLSGCQLRVRSIEPIPGIAFQAGSEPNVLYWTKEVPPITQDADGALRAEANLQRLYQVTSSAVPPVTVIVPVKFPAPEPGAVITAGINCVPALAGAGLFTRTADNTGTLTFKTEIRAQATFKCDKVAVMVDGAAAPRYVGAYEDTAGQFTAQPGSEHALPTLSLISTTPVVDGTIDVTTVAAECNAEGKVFNTETKQCESLSQ